MEEDGRSWETSSRGSWSKAGDVVPSPRLHLQVRDTALALHALPPPPIPGQGPGFPYSLHSQARVVMRAHSPPPSDRADALGISCFLLSSSPCLCFHVFLSHAGCVEHISQKILAFESCCHNNHFITRQAQYLRNAESFLKSVRCTSKGNRSSLFLHYFAGK